MTFAPDHLVLVVGRGFVSARFLQVGDKIRTAAAGTVTITSIVYGAVIDAQTDRYVNPEPYEEDP